MAWQDEYEKCKHLASQRENERLQSKQYKWGETDDRIDDVWRALENREELIAFRAQLHADVPRFTQKNGMEENDIFLSPPGRVLKGLEDKDQRESWNKATTWERSIAKILVLGELDATIDGEPLQATAIWASTMLSVRDQLSELVSRPEETAGSPILSRKSHSQDALTALDVLENFSNALVQAMRKNEREWLREGMAELCQHAFYAGIMAQVAAGKSVEAIAVKGIENSENAAFGRVMREGNVAGGQATARKNAAETQKILQKMEKLVGAGKTVNAAAKIALKKGQGRTAHANRALWYRHQKKL